MPQTRSILIGSVGASPDERRTLPDRKIGLSICMLGSSCVWRRRLSIPPVVPSVLRLVPAPGRLPPVFPPVFPPVLPPPCAWAWAASGRTNATMRRINPLGDIAKLPRWNAIADYHSPNGRPSSNRQLGHNFTWEHGPIPITRWARILIEAAVAPIAAR
jgi:hypothetical protein